MEAGLSYLVVPPKRQYRCLAAVASSASNLSLCKNSVTSNNGC